MGFQKPTQRESARTILLSRQEASVTIQRKKRKTRDERLQNNPISFYPGRVDAECTILDGLAGQEATMHAAIAGTNTNTKKAEAKREKSVRQRILVFE